MLQTTDPHAMTILLASSGAPVRKSYRLDAGGLLTETPYPDIKTWNVRTVTFTDCASLLAALQRTEKAARAIVISGTPAQPVDKDTKVLRRYLGEDAPFTDAPKAWVALDVDDLRVPLGTPEEMAARALDRMPPAFSRASMVYQWTAKQGLVGRETNLLRMRMWFVLDQPAPPTHWRKYAKTLTHLGIDPALYNPVQPHYTQPPEFQDGIPDPFPGTRFGMVERGGAVQVAELGDAIGPPDDARASVDGEVQGCEAQIQSVIERLLGQATTGARHHHALAVACELIAIGCDDARILETCEQVITQQGREPQIAEVENALAFAKKKRDAGTLKSSTVALDTLLPDETTAEGELDAAWDALADDIETDFGAASLVFDAEGTSYYNAVVYMRRKHPDDGFIHWCGGDFEWAGTSWKELEDAKTLQHRIVKESGLSANKAKEIAETLRGIRVHEGLRLGAKLSDPGEPIGSLFNFKNGMLLLEDYMFDPRAPLLPHDKDLFTLRNLPFEYDTQAACPNWERFLSDCFCDDLQTRRELQKMFGYLLSGSTSQQRVFTLQGPSRAGKGVVCRVLEQLVGKSACASKPLEDWTDPFLWADNWDKSIIFAPEANPEGLKRGTGAVIANELKLVSGEDPRNVRRKLKSDLVNVTISARPVLICNRLPAFIDPSDSLFNRLHVLRFRQTFAGREDYDLERRLRAELSGIFNWALEGCRLLLMEDGRFLLPEFSKPFMSLAKEAMAPVGGFMADVVEAGPPEASLDENDLHVAYLYWSRENGRKPLSRGMVQIELMSRFPLVTYRKQNRSKRFYGIQLTEWARTVVADQNLEGVE